MKIVVLHGQSHKGSTWHVTRLLLDEFNEKTDAIREFQTNDIKPCLGCSSCIIKDEELCPHRAVVGQIIETIEQADIVIAESPNYCMGMSGQLKMLFDHMGYRWMSHRPHHSMKHKIGVAVSTTAGLGAEKVTRDIVRQMFWWGVAKTYRLPFTVAAMSWKDVKDERKVKLQKKAKKLAREINKRHCKVKPGIRSKFMFGMMRAMQKGKMSWNPVDRKHWEDNGWI
jgi:multimeric flavodoxin WrbA